ncbi:hypothetical protein D9757_000426 [Collybiopsis confluens]|uniref:non-specific serine/threonine protein kinase n=1 Tax=Collybiopsis confluens TaxID=2823264 RepID=A0A8H5MH16_9AGAR|nr:hypothetical protein D9757_000426 [Collybiopsis confluens]
MLTQTVKTDGGGRIVYLHITTSSCQDKLQSRQLSRSRNHSISYSRSGRRRSSHAQIHEYLTPSSSNAPDDEDDEDEEAGEILFDGDWWRGKGGEIVPYAHRDIKPGDVIISDEGCPILMDFGSAMRARLNIENRSWAVYQHVS